MQDREELRQKVHNGSKKTSVVESEPQGAGTFGWSRSQNIKVSAPAPGSGSAKVVNKNQILS